MSHCTNNVLWYPFPSHATSATRAGRSDTALSRANPCEPMQLIQWPRSALAHLRSPGQPWTRPAKQLGQARKPSVLARPPPETATMPRISYQPSDDNPHRELPSCTSRRDLYFLPCIRCRCPRTAQANCASPAGQFPPVSPIAACSRPEAARNSDSPILVPQSQTPHSTRSKNTVPFGPLRVCPRVPSQ